MHSFDRLIARLDEYKPDKHLGRRFLRRSSVALLLRENKSTGISVLMIKRSEQEGDPWSGHMAFPGGRWEKLDENSLATAQRETWEEIGLDIEQNASRLGRLSDITARPRIKGRLPLIVSPHVFHLHGCADFTLNHEVQDVIWVPLDFFLDQSNRQQMRWRVPQGMMVDLPCYFYQNERIWGLSLRMLDELLALVES
jgi:8-oxo-dGTP pyrophosphatase MutT (NUDIX family)